MNDFAKAILELSKECTTQYVTASRCITARPCWVFKVVPVSDASVPIGEAILRNGEIITSEIVLRLYADYFPCMDNGIFPIYFNRGVYLELPAPTQACMIQYLID